ncbi:hypothetical protein GGR57DRAFT_494716 [Xylariaceae sp. FL1272]|nr:hypothetical protein GGR57DRAFT_494716 [Xylariaceae sp. FL1272]
MPPRLSTQLRPHRRSLALVRRSPRPDLSGACFFCSFPLNSNRHTRRPRKTADTARRFYSSITPATSPLNPDIRKDLELVLLDLQKHAANYVNLSRLQLALAGLRQEPGHESIRVAIIGLLPTGLGGDPKTTLREALRLILADPLKDPQPWELHVTETAGARERLTIRVRADKQDDASALTFTRGGGHLTTELDVSCPTLNGHDLEIVLADMSTGFPPHEAIHGRRLADSNHTMAVDNHVREMEKLFSVVGTVHKALLISEGIAGVGAVNSVHNEDLPYDDPHILASAVNLPGYKQTDFDFAPPTPIDVAKASDGLGLIRKDLSHAMEYEKLWSQSNIPKVVEWLKAGILTTSDNATKDAVRNLIASLLTSTERALDLEEKQREIVSPTPHRSFIDLRKGLDEWAEGAHLELREQLDHAFSSRKWRKLRWWKLFWRVDDVGMLTTDILSQRFLPVSERTSIYLAGRMREAGARSGSFHSAAPANSEHVTSATDNTPTPSSMSNARQWPVQIPAARNYLQTETVPALQALAQKLVLQTLSTSGFTTALGALVYVGTLSTSLYEAGAVAALGIVWSMKRMQKQWEVARDFWEGEVREEGRKAVKGVEDAMASGLEEQILEQSKGADTHDVEQAKALVCKAKDLLEKLK